jgi:sugar phosphate isomerase/epimerase
MKTIKGPGIFLAQFLGDEAPFDTLDHLAEWAAGLGYTAVQIPCTPQLIDLETAAESQSYCDDLRAGLDKHGIVVSELSTHLQGQLVAVHPAYDSLFDGFAAEAVRGKPAERQAWAVEQVKLGARASKRLGLDAHATFSGALAWPYVYPWPQRPSGLVDEAFAELGRRWRPILDMFEECGVDCAFELHPGEDLHDGVTFERFLDTVDQHPRARILYDPSHFVLQQLDYLAFLDIYHERVSCFHVKDAEFRPNGRSGVYGGYQSWVDRPGRFRSLGDGQVDFGAIFSKMAAYDYQGWAVLEWECALKHPQDGAREGAPFIRDHIIRVTPHAFDDFAASGTDRQANRTLLGLDGADA